MAELCFFQSIEAPPELLWRYLSTASGLSCWQADEVRGDLEAGEFSLRWPTLGARLDLSVRKVRRGESLELVAGQNVIEIGLVPGGVQLVHRGLEPDDDLLGFRCSWRLALSTLKHAAEAHPGQPRLVTWMFSPVVMDPGLIHYYFADPAGLGSWLGSTTSALREGDPYELVLDRSTLLGKVLVSEGGRDVALSITPLAASVLVLRSLPAPEDGRIVALGLSRFAEVEVAPLETDLRRALQRLTSLGPARGLS